MQRLEVSGAVRPPIWVVRRQRVKVLFLHLPVRTKEDYKSHSQGIGSVANI